MHSILDGVVAWVNIYHESFLIKSAKGFCLLHPRQCMERAMTRVQRGEGELLLRGGRGSDVGVRGLELLLQLRALFGS